MAQSSGSTHSPSFSLFAPRSFFFGLVFLVLTLPSATPLPPATALPSPTTSRRCHNTCHSTLKPIIILVAALYRPAPSFPFASPGLFSLSNLTPAGAYLVHSPHWT
jgi:hypothetical protein